MIQNKTAWLHDQQRNVIRQWSRSWLWRSEFPTWLLIFTVYGGWFTTMAYWQVLGLFPATLLLIWFTTWYMSLQHELIHGHPTRFARVNQLFGLLPLAVWYPYGLYRDSHLAHHRNQLLTLPDEDPETYYFSAERWQRFASWQRKIIQLRNTFPGRLLLAPLLDILQTVISMFSAFRRLQFAAMAMWTVHIVLLVLLFSWIAHCGFSLSWYLLIVGYPALALTKVRSFLEHRAADEPLARSVINEAALPWRLLFLNLNYHSVHHDLPGVPWYGLRKVYLLYREDYQRRNHGFVVRGYGEWLRRFLLKSVDVGQHPHSRRETYRDE